MRESSPGAGGAGSERETGLVKVRRPGTGRVPAGGVLSRQMGMWLEESWQFAVSGCWRRGAEEELGLTEVGAGAGLWWSWWAGNLGLKRKHFFVNRMLLL